jgi:hypothetical protein
MNDIDISLKTKIKLSESTTSSICPDYDEDCDTITDPVFCWMGTKNCDRAEGLCPLIHNNN